MILPPSSTISRGFYLVIDRLSWLKMEDIDGSLNVLPFTRGNTKIISEPGSESRFLTDEVSL